MEEWKVAKLEDWRDGKEQNVRLEDCEVGGMEEWKVGKKAHYQSSIIPAIQVSDHPLFQSSILALPILPFIQSLDLLYRIDPLCLI